MVILLRIWLLSFHCIVVFLNIIKRFELGILRDGAIQNNEY